MNLKLLGKKLYANRANIAFYSGTILTMVGTGLFIKAARKNTTVIEAHKADMYDAKEDHDEAAKREICKRTVKASVKNYALPACVSAAGYSLQIYSNQTHNKELTILNTALTASTVAFETLKGKIVDKYGEDEWDRLNGVTIVESVNEETGEVTKAVSHEKDHLGKYPFHIFFDEVNPNFSHHPGENRRFLTLKLNQAQRDLAENKVMLFLDVLKNYYGYSLVPGEHFSAEQLEAWSTAGWVYGRADEPTTQIDIGLYRHSEATERFMQDYEDTVLLEFNCIPNVYDELKRIKL